MDKIVFILSLVVCTVNSAKILGVFPTPSVSHQVVYRALFQELHNRGHEITIITTDTIGVNSITYKEVDIGKISYEKWKEIFDFAQQFGEAQQTPFGAISMFMNSFNKIFEFQLNQTDVLEVLKKEKHFDLIIFEWLLTPGYYRLVCQYSAPYIGISSLPALINGQDSIGNPSHPGYLPEVVLETLDKMTFMNRVWSLIYYLRFKFHYYYIYLHQQEAISRKYFPGDCPFIGEIEKNVSLILANTHPLLTFPRPNVPAMIEFGGTPLHMAPVKPLPKDLQEFLDTATDGVIYMSLGSNVKSSTMSEYKLNQFVEAFRRRKEKVLWKWETDVLPGKPENVKTSKWFPQSDILGHPNIKAFISQGGLQSLGESTHHKVPLVVIPIFGDQMVHARKIEEQGAAVRLDYERLTADDLTVALDKVIYDPGYKNRMVKYSELIKDQPLSSIDKAVWWIEYVIRHKGAHHLRTAAVDMPLYQYLMLDVLAFILSIVLFIIYTSYLFIKLIVRLLSKSKTKRD